MTESEKGKPDFDGKIILIDENNMRQPTNLELAELIMMSNASVMAMTQLIMVNRDIMSEDDELQDSIDDLSVSNNSLTQWWYGLLKAKEEKTNDDPKLFE
jgi:hypothetical protein